MKLYCNIWKIVALSREMKWNEVEDQKCDNYCESVSNLLKLRNYEYIENWAILDYIIINIMSKYSENVPVQLLKLGIL